MRNEAVHRAEPHRRSGLATLRPPADAPTCRRSHLPTLPGAAGVGADRVSGGRVALTDGARTASPEATVTLGTCSVTLSVSSDNLPVGETADLFTRRDCPARTVPGAAAVLCTDRAITFTSHGGKAGTGPGGMARSLLGRQGYRRTSAAPSRAPSDAGATCHRTTRPWSVRPSGPGRREARDGRAAGAYVRREAPSPTLLTPPADDSGWPAPRRDPCGGGGPPVGHLPDGQGLALAAGGAGRREPVEAGTDVVGALPLKQQHSGAPGVGPLGPAWSCRRTRTRTACRVQCDDRRTPGRQAPPVIRRNVRGPPGSVTARRPERGMHRFRSGNRC